MPKRRAYIGVIAERNRRGQEMDDRLRNLRKVVVRMDKAFQKELVRVYGEKDAGAARYQLRHEDDAVNRAKQAYATAGMAWADAVISYCHDDF